MLTGGCAFKSPPGRATQDMSSYQMDKEPYHIRPADLLDVRFYKTPELNVEKVPVRKDGKISLDLVGDVQAAGLEPDELAANLTRAYCGRAPGSEDLRHRPGLRRADLHRRRGRTSPGAQVR